MRFQKKFTHATVALLGLVACLTTVSASADNEPAAPAAHEIIAYKQTTNSDGEAVVLRLHVFKPEGWSADDSRPGIVFFFGGGWVGGSPAQFFPHCRDLAAMGMVAISAEYRTEGAHGTPPQACVEDGKSAVRYLREHAAELGIDPNRVVAGGGSAGGHVAACTGVLTGYEAEGEDHEISSVPNLMILFNPVIDTSVATGYGARKVGDNPESLSPLHQVRADQPPSIIFHGDADTTVPIDSIRRFDARCEALGVVCELHEYEGASHGFFNHSDFRRPPAGTPNYYDLTMQQATAFLRQYGYLAVTQ